MKAAFGIVKQQVHEQVYESIKNAILNGGSSRARS